MAPIILKIILCSLLFIAVYYLFLEKEKIYRFNRFYLLSAVTLSYIIPFITVTISSQRIPAKPLLIIEETTQQISILRTEQTVFNWTNVLWGFYMIVTASLLIKSMLAFLAIKKIQGEKLIYQNCNVILTKENLSPFSFWNAIYMGKNYVKNNCIDPRIFLHEKSHLDQKHSIDVMIIDLLKIFTWFNPILFLYKRAVTTNHEFLADEAVLNNEFNIREYQNLILDEIINSQNLQLTHSFNFINTKKRFIMMNAQKTRFSLLRKATGISTLIASIALFSEKIYANEAMNIGNSIQTNHKKTNNVPEIPSAKPEVPPIRPVTDSYNDKIFKETTVALSELKKEKLKTIPDTIAPKAKAESNESNNTNPLLPSNSSQNLTQPEYPDGLRALREKISKNIDVTNLPLQKGVIKSVAYLNIDAMGEMTDIKVSGDNETFNMELLKTLTTISKETTWKPATQDGKAVASVLKIPATMSFPQQ